MERQLTSIVAPVAVSNRGWHPRIDQLRATRRGKPPKNLGVGDGRRKLAMRRIRRPRGRRWRLATSAAGGERRRNEQRRGKCQLELHRRHYRDGRPTGANALPLRTFLGPPGGTIRGTKRTGLHLVAAGPDGEVDQSQYCLHGGRTGHYPGVEAATDRLYATAMAPEEQAP
jgi:hypothetical protein